MSEHESGGENFEKKSAMEDQINKATGISFDYRNEYSAIVSTFHTLEKHPKLAEKLFNTVIIKAFTVTGKFMQKYEERCAAQNFDPMNAVNDSNRDSIAEINRLVEECNQIFVSTNSDPSLDSLQKLEHLKTELMPRIDLIDKLIRG